MSIELAFRGTLDFFSVVRNSSRPAAERSMDCLLELNGVTFARPCGMAAIAAFADRMLVQGRKVQVTAQQSKSFSYMQNMNLFKLFGVFDNETFNRHDQDGKFCRMGRVDFSVETEWLARDMANTIQIPDAPVRGDILTCLSESLSNLWSHAAHSGYAVAQSFKRGEADGWYELAICDGGRGIRKSLLENPAYRIVDDEHAIQLACQRSVSRCPPQADSGHFGVGLWTIDKITETTAGEFWLCSGDSVRYRNKDCVRTWKVPAWQGTIVALKLTHAGILAWHSGQERQSGKLRHD